MEVKDEKLQESSCGVETVQGWIFDGSILCFIRTFGLDEED